MTPQQIDISIDLYPHCICSTKQCILIVYVYVHVFPHSLHLSLLILTTKPAKDEICKLTSKPRVFVSNKFKS